MTKTLFEPAPPQTSALFQAGYLDGVRYRRCRIGLPQGLLDAGDDYARGLRAGYGLAASAITELDTFVDKQATFVKASP